VFFNNDVQQLLKKLTRVDLKKVFRKRKEGQTLEPPEYKFMTTEELDQALKNAEIEAEHRLQMPPVVLERKDISRVLSEDPALKGYDDAKHVFTDITYGVSEQVSSFFLLKSLLCFETMVVLVGGTTEGASNSEYAYHTEISFKSLTESSQN
jgi:small subunit ribosomal protein S22